MVLVLIGTCCSVLFISDMTQVEAATTDYDNGETPVDIQSKADILKNIKDAGENLTILEIVPYNAACTLQILGADPEFLALVKSKAADLYSAFSWNNGVIAGTIAYQHQFKITKKTDGTYVVDYPNFFINALFEDSEYAEYKEYFTTHIDIRTVMASSLTSADFTDVDMVYISGSLENGEVANFYNYLHGISSVSASSTPTGAYYYNSSTNSYVEYNTSQNQQVGYNSFHLNQYNQYESNDISWTVAEELIRFIQAGSTFTTKDGDAEPIPVILNIGNTYPTTQDSNIWKLCNLLCKTTGLNALGSQEGTYYYDTVLSNISTTKAAFNEVKYSYYAATTQAYTNKILKFNSNVKITATALGITVDYSGSALNSASGQTSAYVASGGYVRLTQWRTANYLYVYDPQGILINKIPVTINNNTLNVTYNASWNRVITVTRQDDVYLYNNNIDISHGNAVTGNIITAGYKISGTYYTLWDNKSNPYTYLFDLQAYGKFHVYNYVFITNNNMSSTIFSVSNASITDDGSAALRSMEVVNGKYYISSYIRYLLGMDKADLVSYNKTINVLEIEPCKDFQYDYTTNASATVKESQLANIKKFAAYVNFKGYAGLTTTTYEALMANTTAAKINFTCVTTGEYNGMNEDLIEKYDVIVIGSQTGMMNLDSSGKTIYNDTTLDGYIYLAYGDLIKVKSILLGLLPTDYVAVTDTVIKNAGYTPITQKTASTTTGLNSGTKVVYSKNIKSLWSPGLYSQLQSLSGTYFVIKDVTSTFAGVTNVTSYYQNALGNARFSGNDITAKKKTELLKYVKSGQAVILADNIASSQTDSAGGVVYPTSNLYGFVSEAMTSANVIKQSTASSSLLGLLTDDVLNITSCQMLYDKDGDGINETQVPASAYDSNGLLKSSSILANVKSFTYQVSFASTVGDTYAVRLILDKNTDGLYHEEPSTDDKNEVFYTKTLTATKTATSLTFNINLPEGYNGMLSWRFLVQETKTQSGYISRQSVDGYTTVTGEKKIINVLQILPDTNNNTLNMKTNTTFTQLLATATKDINYQINIDTMTADEYEKLFAASPYTATTDYDSDKNYLKKNKYGMVIIGFEDIYGGQDISNDNGALDCILDYIAKGNSVLFTHDTVGFNSSVNSKIIQSGNSIAFNSEGDKWGTDFTRVLRDTLGMDRYSVTTLTSFTDATALAAANVPKNKNGSYITEIQGLTNSVLYRFSQNTNYVTSRAASGLYTLTVSKNDKNYGLANLIKTTTVEALNQGQITKYPYNTIDANGTLAVATTHAQYFQLDMEDKDVVVWYTLAGADATYNGDNSKDAGNNYYIYSKGNITYSGAGHSTMNVTDELELFVNTIVKAVVAGNFVPEISVKNAATLKGDHSYVLYPNSLDNAIQVVFEASDDDMASREMVSNSYTKEADILAHIGRFNSGAVYWVDQNGTEKILVNYKYGTADVVLNGEKTTFTLYDPFAGATDVAAAYAAGTQVQKNMYDCYQEYLTNGLTNLKIQVSDSYGETGTSYVKISEHELFDLD